MTLFGAYTREELRQSYALAWQKQLGGSPLSPLEALLADVIGVHPEYQAALKTIQGAVALEAPAGENPFLHMGLHVAVREQLSIDRPPGVRDLHRRLQVRLGDAHDAEHVLMEALAETLWEAQRGAKPPDERHYLALAGKDLAARGPRPAP